jgi:hypothetical protein
MEVVPTLVLQQELQYFERRRLDLLTSARGKYALIKGSELAGTFDSESEAVGAGYRRFGNEPFLVKHIVEADLTLTFATFNLGT